MSVPFSNTHLRVPRGFGTLLEGLAREVLRDQPEDIPQYAALYFDALLKQREDSGMDPAEWAAKLEDRFYNNHAFKTTGASPEKEPAAEVTISKDESAFKFAVSRVSRKGKTEQVPEKSDECPTEDESSHSAEASDLSTTQPNVSEEVELTESPGEEDEKHDITEEHVNSTEKGLSDEESVKRLRAADAQSDEPSGTEEKEDDPPTFGGTAGEQYSNPTELSSFRGISDVDVCAQELGSVGDEGGETAAEVRDIVDSEEEEKTEAEEPVEVYLYSGLADVDVCATELVGAERTVEGATAEDNTLVREEESSKPQSEETVVQDNQQVAEDRAEKAKEEDGRKTETPSGGTHESLSHTEGDLVSNVIPTEDSFVEISFEDVPEPQQNTEVLEKQPEVLNTNILEMQQEEESEEESAEATDQNISGAQDHGEPEMVGAEKELNPEGEEMESQHEASDMTKEKVETADSNSNDSKDDETGEGVKTIGSSHQPTSEAEAESPEHETDLKNEETAEISESEFHQNESNDPDVKDEDKTDTVEGKEEEDMQTEGRGEVEDQETNDGAAGNHSSEETQTNVSTAAMEAESETLEQLPEENEESQRTLVESQPEDEEGEKQVTSKEKTSEAEGLVEEGKIDSATQETSDAMCEESSISLTQSTDRLADEHRGEESQFGSEQDTTEPEGHSGDKQEDCSRPQEEEDIMDIPLDDPEANRAAAKIQAGFRGHMTRKKMKPEDKAEGEEVSSTGDVLNGSQGDTETGGSGAVERDDTSVPEQ